MRTFNRVDWEASLGEWGAGDFSDEWKPYRHQAAMRGIIYPPTGTKWDSWEDDEPSQRAVLIRAIRETPRLLERCIAHAGSWSEVVSRLMAERDELREQGWNASRQEERERDEVTDYEATVSIKRILDRIGAS